MNDVLKLQDYAFRYDGKFEIRYYGNSQLWTVILICSIIDLKIKTVRKTLEEALEVSIERIESENI